MAYKRNRKGTIILRNGQRITLREQKSLKSAVSSANRKRKRLLEKLPKEAKMKYNIFGKESDFVNRKRNVKFSKFRNKKEFNHYLRMSQRIASGEFQKTRQKIFKQNYIKSLVNNYNWNDETIEAIDLIEQIDDKTFAELIDSEKLETIEWQYYDPENNKLKKTIEALRAVA